MKGRYFSAVACLAATPLANAVTLGDDDGNSLGFGIRLQNRIDFNQGINDNQGNPVTDQAGVDTVDFYLRRVRLYMKGKAKWGQKFNLTMSADNLGKPSGGDRSPQCNARGPLCLGQSGFQN